MLEVEMYYKEKELDAKYQKRADKYTQVHYASKNNSTKFTNCCNVAVSETDKNCPWCGAKIDFKIGIW